MLYEAEQGQATLPLCGDIVPSRRLAVFREPKFLKLRQVLNGADACFANLESMVVRYGEGKMAEDLLTQPGDRGGDDAGIQTNLSR